MRDSLEPELFSIRKMLWIFDHLHEILEINMVKI